MTDIPYTSSGLEDWCPESSSVRSGASSWVGVTGVILGVLALGTALYAAFAPRNVVSRGAEAVGSAISRGASKAKQAARQATEQAQTAMAEATT